ncbi:MAG: adenine phosphoribosyltransferase [Acidimicrobiia bacterium]
MDIDALRALVRDIPDFPEEGIVFKDITPVLASREALAQVVDGLAEPFRETGVDIVAGIEARGFILATPVADVLGSGFVPVRKPGKLPYQTQREEYELEYGTDALEVHIDAARPGEKVLIVDDVLATGGTASAAARLLSSLGAEVVGVSVFIELGFLGGRAQLDGLPFYSMVTYDD